MLEKSDGYSENQWQNEVLGIILLIYPKYLLYIQKLRIQDTIQTDKHREIDIALFDENGSIDIIEIKTPMKFLLSHGLYRDNYVPSRELTGAIMQLEKYVYHLNRLGIKGEQDLRKKYDKDLQKYNLKVHITNPKGLIIAGRSNDWKSKQLLDFEIIKRKHAHIVDIITYDDLIKRLENLIEKFSF